MSTEDKQLRALKRLVKTLGVLLIIGSIAVFSIAVGRLTSKVKLKQQQDVCQQMASTVQQVKGKIERIKVEKNAIMMISRQKHTVWITTVDRCTGQVVQEIRVEEEVD